MVLHAILGTLSLFAAFFTAVFAKDYYKAYKEGALEKVNFVVASAVGFIINFFDTLGVGSFAPATAIFKFSKMVRDKDIPGTLNVANCLPVVTEALIFMTIVEVETFTLVTVILSAIVGAYFGAGLVSKLPERKIQLAMGTALLVVAVIMTCSILGIMPAGGDEIGLSGIPLIIACVGSFILGITNCLGIGSYAPMMGMVFALGLSPRVAFPLMMGSAAFLQPVASAMFVKEGAYNKKVSMAITIFGIIGVIIAAYIVKELPVDILRKLVVAVVLITSADMFRSALKKPKQQLEESKTEIAKN